MVKQFKDLEGVVDRMPELPKATGVGKLTREEVGMVDRWYGEWKKVVEKLRREEMENGKA